MNLPMKAHVSCPLFFSSSRVWMERSHFSFSSQNRLPFFLHYGLKETFRVPPTAELRIRTLPLPRAGKTAQSSRTPPFFFFVRDEIDVGADTLAGFSFHDYESESASLLPRPCGYKTGLFPSLDKIGPFSLSSRPKRNENGFCI